jgi:mannose-1-phosphate guanylyltransferase
MDEADVNTVNAGAYVFDRAVLLALKDGHSSLEREMFPSLLSDGGLQAYESRGYWIDIGTLERYLQVHLDLLSGRTRLPLPKTVPSLDGGRVAVGAGAKIDETVRFSGNVSVGAGCRIGAGSVLRDCVLLDGVKVGENARVEGCIVGPRSRIGARSELTRCLALAGGSRIEPFSRL